MGCWLPLPDPSSLLRAWDDLSALLRLHHLERDAWNADSYFSVIGLITGEAALKLVLPDWEAVTLTVPLAFIVAIAPETVSTFVLLLA